MRIALVILGRIGDLILATSMLSAIKDKYPDSEIVLISGAGNSSIVESDPRISEIVRFDKNPMKLLLFAKYLMANKFDYLIDPKDHYSSESALIAKLSRADKKIGFNRINNNKPFDIPIPSDADNAKLHYSERCLQALASLGIDMNVKKYTPKMFLNKTVMAEALSFISSLPKTKYILVNISATRPERMYRVENWVETISYIDKSKHSIALNFVESDRAKAEQIKKSCDCVYLSPFAKIEEFAALVKHSDITVTPDTSAVHMLSAFNKAGVALYNDIEPNYSKFRPLIDSIRVLKPEGSMNINNIPPIEIANSVNEMLIEQKETEE
jgi:ADP-heptose:LPS heptosyltransferase